MRRLPLVVVCVTLLVLLAFANRLQAGPPPDERRVAALLSPHPDIEKIRALGPGVLPVLASLYERAPEAQRPDIAWTFYELGWPSDDAKRVLMKDAHTQNTDLRLQVQWALGRVSNDADVV